MTTIDDTTAPAVQAANAHIDAAIDALLALRNLAAEHPDIADDIRLDRYGSNRIHVYVGDIVPARSHTDVAARIAKLAEAAQRHGAILRPDSGGKYGGVWAAFGPFEMHIYAPVEQVGTSGTREVTEWQLDPRLAALGTEAAS